MVTKNKRDLRKKVFLLLLLHFFIQGKALAYEEKKDNSLRIVTLAPNLTRFVIEAGGSDHLVGASFFSQIPPGRDVQIVGTFINPDLEKIYFLSPDIVLITTEGNPPWVKEKLEKMGIKTLLVSVKKLEDIIYWLRNLAGMLGDEEHVEEKIKEYEKILSLPSCPPLNSAILIETEPPFVSGSDTYLHDLLIKSGLKNIFSFSKGYFQIDEEKLLTLKPQLLIIPYSRASSPLIKKYLKNSRILSVNDEDLLQPSPLTFSLLKKIKVECSSWKENQNQF